MEFIPCLPHQGQEAGRALGAPRREESGLPSFCHSEAGELGGGEGLGPRDIGNWRGWMQGVQMCPLGRTWVSVGHWATLAPGKLPPWADESELGGL